MTLEIRLLGQFEIRSEDAPIRIASRRGRALLGYLALSPGMSVTRVELAALLWPDRSEEQSRASLRQELATIRKALGQSNCDLVFANTDSVTIPKDCGASIDVRHLMKGNLSADEFATVCRGALLADVDLPSADYEVWLAQQRRQVDARILDLIETGITAATEKKDWVTLEDLANKLIRIDPLGEAAIAANMRVLVAKGRKHEASMAYDAYCELLNRDLQAEPSAELTGLRDRLIAGPGKEPDTKTSRADSQIFDRPAVLLLAFDHMASNDEDRAFALGISNGVRTNLAYWRWFPVIGPETFGWKTSQELDLRAEAKRTGAKYAVTGALRRAGDRVRLNVTLTSTEDGQTLWSNQFDGTLDDVFEFEEQVGRSIVAQLEPEISHAEATKLALRRPNNVEVWQLMLQAAESERRGGDGYGTQAANTEQVALAKEAINKVSDYSQAWSLMAKCNWRAALMGWKPDREATIDAAIDAASKATQYDASNWEAHAYAGTALMFGKRQHESAMFHVEEAVRLNPSSASARHGYACVLEHSGRSAEAIEQIDALFRLNPDHPNKAAVLGDLTTSYSLTGVTDKATETARRIVALTPGYARGLQRAISAFGHAGESVDAQDAIAKLNVVMPDFSQDYVEKTYPFKRREDLEHFLEGLRKAGAL